MAMQTLSILTGDEKLRLLPPGISGDSARVLAARGVRAFAHPLLLPIFLVDLGFNSLAIGSIVESTIQSGDNQHGPSRNR
jgi:hypothetical protein